MRRSPRRLCVALVLGFVVAGAASARLAGAAAPSWQLERVRVEPSDSSGSLLLAGSGAYRGALEVARGPGGLSVVNDVGFEDYVRGVAEMPPTWPTQALRAQAIAARTYALWHMLTRPPSSRAALEADICATDACQVYAGSDREPAGGSWSSAVEATSGQVLLWRGLVIEALYSASNGGRSTGGGVPWLPQVDDPDDAWSPFHRWHWSASLSSLASALGVDPAARLVSVAGDQNGIELGVARSDGGVAHSTMSAADFHSRLNQTFPAPSGLPLPLPSLRFSVATEGADAIVDGGGWGHGLGLNQAGALGKAGRGMQAGDILASYYGGARPVQLAPRNLPARIRVDLGSDRTDVSISASGPVRVLDGAGHVLADAASGHVLVRPEGTTMRVTAQLDASSPDLRLTGPGLAPGPSPLAAAPAALVPAPPAAEASDRGRRAPGLPAKHVVLIGFAIVLVGATSCVSAMRAREAHGRRSRAAR